MDLDRFIAQRQPAWERLESLSRTARRPRKLRAAELDEFIALYQQASTDLAQARSTYNDVALVARLSQLVGLSRTRIYRQRTHAGRAIVTFFGQSFPQAVWSMRRAIALAAAILLATSVASGVWLGVDTHSRNEAISPSRQQSIAQSEFRQYYSDAPAQSFQTLVTFNNIFVSFIGLMFGVLAGIPTMLMLVRTGANVGAMAAIMHTHGKGLEFWSLIIPHGLLELSAVCLACGAGFSLAWAVISPGDRTRGAAFRQHAQRAGVVAAGVTVCFLIAGATEAWITPSSLPPAARIAYGVALEVGLFAYLIRFGRPAETAEDPFLIAK